MTRGLCAEWAETWSKTQDKYWFWGPWSHGTWHKNRGSWVFMRGRQCWHLDTGCRVTSGGHKIPGTRCDPHAQCFPPLQYSCKMSHSKHISLKTLRPGCHPIPPIYLPQTLTGACHALCHAQCHVTVTLSRTLVSSVSEWGQRCLRVTLRPVDINLFLTVLLNTDTIRDSTWQFSSAPLRPGSIKLHWKVKFSLWLGSHLQLRRLRLQAAGECPRSTRCQLWHMAFKTRRFQLTFLRESNGFSEWLAFFEYFGHVSGLSVLKALFPFDISTSTMLWLFLGRIWLSWSGLMAILVTPVPNSMLRLVRELSLSTSRTVITAMVTMRMSINKITQQPYLLSCCGQFPLIV